MGTLLRRSGIRALGDVPWGTHFCVFYRSPGDMLDILLPYFTAGLEQNECCVWITSEPLQVDEAEAALRRAYPLFDEAAGRGQIEIIPHTEWYLRDDRFDSARILEGWLGLLARARARGLDGLRLSGNTFWLEERHWRHFIDYEREINTVIEGRPMLALCTYSLERCGAAEIIDVVSTHQFALVRRGGAWERIRSEEQRLAQEALRESLLKCRVVADNTYDFEFWLAPDGKCLYASPSCERITGYTAPQFLADPGLLRRIVHPDDLPRYDAHVRETEARKGLAEIEHRIIRADGRTAWIAHACLPAYDGAGRHLGLRGSSRDVTDRVETERALREARDRYRTLYETVADGVVSIDLEGRFLSANPAYLRMLGYTMDELARLTSTDVTPGKWRAMESRIVRGKVLKRGWAPPYEKEYIRKDGTVFPVELAVYLIRDARGAPAGMCGVARDITARRRLEDAQRRGREELRRQVRERTRKLARAVRDLKAEIRGRRRAEATGEETARMLEAFFRHTIACLVILDRKFNFIRVNNAYARACGMDAAEFPGKNHFDLYPSAELEAAFRKAVATRVPYQATARPFVFPDHPEWGETHWDLTLVPVSDARGRLDFLVFALQDVTERVRAEQRLLAAERRLLEAKRLSDIGTLAATVAHELRNPLAAIKMAAYNIRRKAPGARLAPHLATIDRKVDDSDEIINNLLFYSRIKQAHHARLRPASVLRECIATAARRHPGNRVTVRRRLAPISGLRIDADPLQVRELFVNILNNAFDALGGRAGVVTVEARRKPRGMVSVRIGDTGAGLAPADLERVFDPFFSTKSRGTGLGLTVCRQIADLHRGAIRIESAEGKGTAVTVTLPLRRPRGNAP
ncbi:MAG: PAS domain S-box protein [bacterium]|nr:PAS domain S-box protein [bacterium]